MRLIGVACLSIALVLATASCVPRQPEADPQACAPPRPLQAGWSASFVAPCRDQAGKLAGGSQIIHLVGHQGALYAASGDWLDRHNIWYGGADPEAGWSQVLRLAGPDQPWRVDLELGPRHLRTELLAELSFTRDPEGRPLPAPETRLLAATYDDHGRFGGSATVFMRDDAGAGWTRTTVVADTGRRGEDNSVRAAAVYRDRITGQERVFLSVGTLGIVTGSRDPGAPGGISWSATPESPATDTRVLSIVEANDSLFFSSGTRIFRRLDGPVPLWVTIADLGAEAQSGTSRALFQSIGGIRGLSAIDGPVPGRQSLIFVWHQGANSQACVLRLDPLPDGTWRRTQEACLDAAISRYLGGAPIGFVLGAYNKFVPLRDPASGGTLYLIGLEAFIPNGPAGRPFQHLTAHNQRPPTGGFYAGGLYALRDVAGHWRIGEVNGRYQPGQPEFVSVYTAALSPFAAEAGRAIYLGGYDPNHFPSSDTAWVARAALATLLGR